ncbi:ead/Ea22-like family protein [Enterobacter asburiae]|uniref:Ead/Ea22-like family protein n=1 Tax=Enterobacter asburiae TaxID=61645 RepID=A0A7W3DFA5_ENTAS|nr:ead/Ea22-like family protein [Enterobacter asburiae]MBA7987444.1 ead/Ea22-like family protein [Enterobacter asburiae]MBA8077638.1 ead/Ea22-like family protein [Enterobacter asburiae]
MINIDKRALREAAERAGQNDWEYVYTSDLSAPGRGYITVGGAEAIYCLNKAAGGVKQSENVLRYIAAASPETMLALLNEIAELEQRHCGTALLEREEMHTKTLGRMLDELDAKDRRIAELELKLEAADKLQDSAFRHGLQHGFSYGQTDNQAGFEQAIQAYGQQWKGE